VYNSSCVAYFRWWRYCADKLHLRLTCAIIYFLTPVSADFTRPRLTIRRGH